MIKCNHTELCWKKLIRKSRQKTELFLPTIRESVEEARWRIGRGCDRVDGIVTYDLRHKEEHESYAYNLTLVVNNDFNVYAFQIV